MKTLILVVMLFTMVSASATTQERELWLIRGKKFYCNHFPHIKKVFPNYKFPEFTWNNTANYKGYTASWAVFDKHLYLIGIQAWVKGSEKIIANTELMKGKKFPIKVTDWSGVVMRKSPVSAYDPNTNKTERSYKVTTLTFKEGALVNTKFDEKVKRESK